jgi:hypothetical protein
VRPVIFLGVAPDFFYDPIDNLWHHLWMMSYRGYYNGYIRQSDGYYEKYIVDFICKDGVCETKEFHYYISSTPD